jgi:hypothetical protein
MTVSKFNFAEDRPGCRRLVRPLHIGLSVGHPSGTCGSLGAFVIGPKGQIGFLSTANVLAPARAAPGDRIHQPSAVDIELSGSSRIAELSVLIARPAPGTRDATDAAVAWLIDPPQTSPLNSVPPDMPDAGRVIWLGGRPLAPGDLVAMVGRSSGYSQAIVETVDTVIPVRIARETVDFPGCVAVRSANGAFTLPGDAGALVWRVEDGLAAGMVFAAASATIENHPLTFILPLGPILDRFSLKLA